MNDTKHCARLAAACVALLAAAGAGAIELSTPRPGDMTRYELPGYTLVAVDNTQLRRDMVKLPRLKRALELAMDIDVKATGIPTRVYVVSTSIWDRYLEHTHVVSSNFVPTRFANYVIADNSGIDRFALYHEHARLYLYNQMPGVYPLWFDEGLAVMMADAQYSDKAARFVPALHDDRGGWIPIERVLRATRTSPEYLDQKSLISFHFESFSMVYRGLVEEPDFGKRMFKYLEEINNLATPEQAEKSFGVSLADLDFQMRAYVNQSNKKKATLRLDGVSDLVLPAGTPVSKLDALLGIATVCLDTGLGLERAYELLDAADKEPGGAARAAPLRMRLAAKRGDDAELEKGYAALKDSSDPAAAGMAGLALFDRAQAMEASSKRIELMTRGFELLNRAIKSTDDPETVWAFAMLSADLNRDLDVALQRLLPMFERLPNNPDLAHAAGKVLYVRGGQDVIPYLNAVLRDAHSLEQKQWAMERIQALRARAGAAPSSTTQ